MKKHYLGIILVMLCISTITLAANDSTELEESISWMHESGLTQYSDKDSFKANKNIRRDESAKFFVLFTKNILNKFGKDSTENSPTEDCSSFTDVDKKNTMKAHISDACNLGIIKGSNKRFKPANNLTNAQAVAIIIRMIEGDLNEPKNDWSVEYYAKAEEFGFLDNLPLDNKKGAITRGSLAILLYRVNAMYDQYKQMADVFQNTGSTNTGN